MSFLYALFPVRNLLSSSSLFFYVKRAFLFFQVFSLSRVLSNLIDVSWCKFFHVSCAWGSLNFSDLWVYNFHQIWKLFSHFFLKYFFLFSLFLSLSLFYSPRLCLSPLL